MQFTKNKENVFKREGKNEEGFDRDEFKLSPTLEKIFCDSDVIKVLSDYFKKAEDFKTYGVDEIHYYDYVEVVNKLEENKLSSGLFISETEI